jgi:hypothetical protein
MSFDFDTAVNAPFRMQPGLRRLAPGAPQLTPSVVPNRGNARHLREKLAVFSAYADQALLVQPGFDPEPAIRALALHAAAEHPDAISYADGRLHARWLGWSLDAGARVHDEGSGWPEIGPLLDSLAPAWRKPVLLSLAFAEDFTVIDGRTTTIPWLAVALPSHWAPEEKVGRPFATVHAPVADNRLIVGAADHLSRLVTGSERWERFVWTVTANPRLHAHPKRVDAQRWPTETEADAAQLVSQAFFRSERQTFIPLPRQAQAVFTIAVDVQPLRAAADTPARAAQLHAAIASMSDAVLEYRGLAVARSRLLHWLAEHAAG